MSSAHPKVSILIPTFNQEEFIGACISSALQQTYRNLEVVVSDDASTDATERIAREFLSDARFRYDRNQVNMGRVGNYRRLLNELASGDWMLMLDGDDCLVNREYIAHAVDLARSEASIVLVFGKHLSGPDVPSSTLCNAAPGLPPVIDGSAFFLQHPPFGEVEPKALTCLVRRDLAVSIDFYRYDIISSDFESYYRLMLGHKIGFLDEISGLWRQHERNASKTCSYEIYRNNFKAILGPYENARSMQIASPSKLRAWLRQSAARHFLFCLHRLLAGGRTWGGLRLAAYVLKLDPGIIVVALSRVIRRTKRGMNDRLRSVKAV
jgi:glycosyltransferase involved in cell wall biosynthesis